MKTPNTINELFKKERDSITVPSRAEFRGILECVTKNVSKRNTGEEARRSLFLLSKKPALILVALCVIVFIVIPKKPFIHNAIPALQSTSAESSVSVETDAIIADIMIDLNEENALLQNEFSAEKEVGDDSDILDTILIS